MAEITIHHTDQAADDVVVMKQLGAISEDEVAVEQQEQQVVVVVVTDAAYRRSVVNNSAVKEAQQQQHQQRSPGVVDEHLAPATPDDTTIRWIRNGPNALYLDILKPVSLSHLSLFFIHFFIQQTKNASEKHNLFYYCIKVYKIEN